MSAPLNEGGGAQHLKLESGGKNTKVSCNQEANSSYTISDLLVFNVEIYDSNTIIYKLASLLKRCLSVCIYVCIYVNMYRVFNKYCVFP